MKSTIKSLGCSAQEARSLMNRWGKARRPFLFLIDYKCEDCIVHPLDSIDTAQIRFEFPRHSSQHTAEKVQKSAVSSQTSWQIHPSSFADYERGFHLVQRHIARGDSFLVNYTCAVPISTQLSLDNLFASARADYKVWVKDQFVCFSPEPFVKIEGARIRTFPMKGTILERETDAAQQLLSNPKEQAEHATIVDLLRNDLSQIASGVHVEQYRYIQRVETKDGGLLQTSSAITGQLAADAFDTLGDLLFALLPAGSVTGAPKPKTLEIIDAAEDHERGFYTGVMGVFDGSSVDSAVMIRFVEQQTSGQLVYKAGGGITMQSQAWSEYDEVIQKAYCPIPLDDSL